MPTILEFDLKKKLGTFQLDVQASLDGGLAGVFGRSGSGKTTLLNCLTGFLKPDAGRIVFNGTTVFSSADRVDISTQGRKFGMVFQEDLLFPHLTVKQNIFYGRRRRDNKKYVKEVIDLLALYKLVDRYPSRLSGGERQRVALARVLLYDPDVILMDEPVSSLDVSTRYQVLAYIKKTQRAFKVPMIYVSHSLSELLFLADNVLVLEDGRSTDFGPAAKVLLPRHEGAESGEEVENIYELPVLGIKAGNAALAFGPSQLMIGYGQRPIKPRVKVGIKARDIIVSTQAIDYISARNIIPARLEQAIEHKDHYLLSTVVGTYTCLVEITRAAYEDLQLDKAKEVYLIIKSRSIIVWEEVLS